MIERTFWKVDQWGDGTSADNYQQKQKQHEVGSLEEADLVGSLLPNGRHAPVIDIDLPCRLVESKTPGHHHLYIDKELTWGDYRRLLRLLSDIGIVEYGYYGASLAHGQTFVRVPKETASRRQTAIDTLTDVAENGNEDTDRVKAAELLLIYAEGN